MFRDSKLYRLVQKLVEKANPNIIDKTNSKNKIFVYKAYWQDSSISITIAQNIKDALFFFDTEGDVYAIDKIEVYDIELLAGAVIQVPRDEAEEIVFSVGYSKIV